MRSREDGLRHFYTNLSTYTQQIFVKQNRQAMKDTREDMCERLEKKK